MRPINAVSPTEERGEREDFFFFSRGNSCESVGRTFLARRLNGFLGLSLNDRTILFQVILWDKTVLVG